MAKFLVRYARFAGTSAVGSVIERFFGWDVVICNLVAMFFSGIISFSINNLLIFKKKKTQ